MAPKRVLELYLLLLLSAMTNCQLDDVRKPPVIQSPQREETLYFNEYVKVVVNCSSDGQPPPVYKWQKNGTDIVGDNFMSFDATTGSLTIPSFTTREEGIFMCIATNSFGGGLTATSFSPRVNLLQIRIDKFIEAGEVTRETREYNYIKLDCANKGKAVGNDLVYNWYNSDTRKVIDLDNNRLFIDEDGNLHFSYVLRSDVTTAHFQYLCGISTSDGKLVRLGTTTRLGVTLENNPSAIKPQFQYSNTGVKGIRFSSVDLECLFSGYDPNRPGAIVTRWFDESNKEIMDDAKFSRSSGGRILTIKNLQEEDEKTYYCRASNIAGETPLQSVFLNVTSKPIFVNGAPRDLTLPEGSDAYFNCEARSASREQPPAAPVWFINGIKMGPQNDPTKFVMLNNNNILSIKNVKKATDILCIQCEVSNDMGSILSNACLNVIKPITIEKHPPPSQNIRKGDSLDFTVTASTDPSMTLNYRWEFKNTSYEGDTAPPFMNYNPATKLAFMNTSSLTEEQYGSIGGVYRRVVYHAYEVVNVDTDVVLDDRAAAAAVGEGGFSLWIIGLIIGLILLIIVILLIIFIICRKQQEGDYNVDKKETGAGLDPEKELKDKDFNAFSRPVYDDYDFPDKKPSAGDPEYDDAPIGGDDESLGEYGKEDMHFNEDGSFIGIYQSKMPPPDNRAESSI